MPLLDPTQCSLLLLNAQLDLPAQVNASPQPDVVPRYALIHAAARATAAPLYVVTRGDPAPGQGTSPASSANASYRYPAARIRALWAERGLAQAVANQRRPSLVLAGSWLETDVTIITLSALADGFDTHVLFDASPSQHMETRQIAINRMLQAGAVPLSTVQLVHEWAERSSDDRQRRTLLDLLEFYQIDRMGAHA